MKILRTFVSGALAGVCIALGGTVFLLTESRLAGALLFTVGLFTICTCGFSLFTGRVCYVFQRGGAYAASLPVIWLGNLAGTALIALIVSVGMTAFVGFQALIERATRIGPALQAAAETVCAAKLGDTPGSVFLLAVLCNVLIYIAVDGFANNPHEIGKYLALFFGVTVFILCGFEHCVANMYYFTAAGVWSLRTLGCLLLMTAGNAVGGVLLPLARGWLEKGK